MKTTILFAFITSLSFGQTSLPQKDTIIFNKDGSETHYQVKPHAVFMTTFKNGKWNGPYKSFYKNGKLWCENNRIDDKIEGESIQYTPNGDTAEIEISKDNRIVKKTIFYQNTRDNPQTYFFVSKTGFNLVENGKQKTLDSTTPDSLIEEGPDFKYMWLKGEKKLISGNEQKFVLILTGSNPGWYRVEGDKQTFFRPMTEGEKAKFIPAKTKEKKKK